MTRTTLENAASRLILIGALAGLTLAGCNQGAASNSAAQEAAQAPPPQAALPLDATAAPPLAPAPAVDALPAARPLRYGRLANPRDQYAFADRAYTVNEAFADAPPDYTFDYDGVRPWVWRSDRGALRVVEPTAGGDRYYYYQPGADTPYLVRDPDYSYAYEQGQLVAVYGRDGRLLDEGAAQEQADRAARYYARAQGLYGYAQRRPHMPVAQANWADRRDALARERDQWVSDQQQQPDWRAYHEQYAPQEQSGWQDEHYRREAEAARFALTINDLAAAARYGQAAQQARAQIGGDAGGQGGYAGGPGGARPQDGGAGPNAAFANRAANPGPDNRRPDGAPAGQTAAQTQPSRPARNDAAGPGPSGAGPNAFANRAAPPSSDNARTANAGPDNRRRPESAPATQAAAQTQPSRPVRNEAARPGPSGAGPNAFANRAAPPPNDTARTANAGPDNRRRPEGAPTSQTAAQTQPGRPAQTDVARPVPGGPERQPAAPQREARAPAAPPAQTAVRGPAVRGNENRSIQNLAAEGRRAQTPAPEAHAAPAHASNAAAVTEPRPAAAPPERSKDPGQKPAAAHRPELNNGKHRLDEAGGAQ